MMLQVSETFKTLDKECFKMILMTPVHLIQMEIILLRTEMMVAMETIQFQ
jgi:hypothetical protein